MFNVKRILPVVVFFICLFTGMIFAKTGGDNVGSSLYNGMAFRAVFRLGVNWSKELKKFPVCNKNFLIVDLTVANKSNKVLFLYFDDVWLHLDEEDQHVNLLHAEEIAPKVYGINRVIEKRKFNQIYSGSRVKVYSPGPVYRNGQVIVNPMPTAGVVVDLSKRKDKDSPISLEKFTLALFKVEFKKTLIKPNETARGLLYFLLPWECENVKGVQLHLEGFLGGAEDIVLKVSNTYKKDIK